MRILPIRVVATLIFASCIARGHTALQETPLARRPCPSPQALRAAFLADSAKRNVDDQPAHSYVSYLVNGRVVAANLRQDSLPSYSSLHEIYGIAEADIRELKVYRADSAPSELGICAGVIAVDLRTKTPVIREGSRFPR